MSNYFTKLYQKTVEEHRLAIRNFGICERAINKGDKRKIVKTHWEIFNVDSSTTSTKLHTLNDMLRHFPELDPEKEIEEYDPSDMRNCCISCVPRYMTFTWLQIQMLMKDNPHLTEDMACLSVLRSSDDVIKYKKEIEELKSGCTEHT